MWCGSGATSIRPRMRSPTRSPSPPTGGRSTACLKTPAAGSPRRRATGRATVSAASPTCHAREWEAVMSHDLEPDPSADLGDIDTVPDDQLRLIFLCCDRALGADAQVALTLRLPGGLTTAEIARAVFVPQATIGPSWSNGGGPSWPAPATHRAAGRGGPAGRPGAGSAARVSDLSRFRQHQDWTDASRGCYCDLYAIESGNGGHRGW
jgi:hypothetical protein